MTCVQFFNFNLSQTTN